MKWQSAKKQSPLSYARSHKFKSILILFIFLTFGWFIYEKIALELNRQAFAHARSSIDSLYADIVTQVGEPDNFKRYNSCNIVRGEFSSGPTYCFVETKFAYGISDLESAQQAFKNIQSIVKSHPNIFKEVKLTTEIMSVPVGNDLYQSTNDLYKSRGLNCTISYIYDTPKLSSLTVKNAQNKVFQTSIGCSSKVLKAFYPLEN